MAQFKTQLVSNKTWSAKRRYKVNSVVLKDGIPYQNVTGLNGVPGVSSDWIAIEVNEIPNLQQVLEVGNTTTVDVEFNTSMGPRKIFTTLGNIGSSISLESSNTTKILSYDDDNNTSSQVKVIPDNVISYTTNTIDRGTINIAPDNIFINAGSEEGDNLARISLNTSGSITVTTLDSDGNPAKGLIGYYDYSANITDLDYTQKKYIVDNFVSLTANQNVFGNKTFKDVNNFDTVISMYDTVNGDYGGISMEDGNFLIHGVTGTTNIKNSSSFEATLNFDALTNDRQYYPTNASGIVPIVRTTAPTSSTDTGVKGEIYMDSTGLYYCYATNSWRKTTGSTF